MVPKSVLLPEVEFLLIVYKYNLLGFFILNKIHGDYIKLEKYKVQKRN